MSARFERLIEVLETLGLLLGDDIYTEEQLATRVELAASNFRAAASRPNAKRLATASG